MATTTFTTMIPTPSKNVAAKKPGPPVPPRPQQSSLLRMQRDGSSAAQRPSSKAGSDCQPQVLRKPSLTLANSAGARDGAPPTGGRTVVYKSPSLNLQKRHDEREKRAEAPAAKANAVTQTTTSSKPVQSGLPAPKPPLKLRKAPDVPTSKPPPLPGKHEVSKGANDSNNNNNKDTNAANIVIVQSLPGGVTLNRHHSMNTPTHAKPLSTLKDSRLSLGRADFERVGKIHLDQLQPAAQPLPRPRKIVKMPVATLDVDETATATALSPAPSALPVAAAPLGVSLFKRSKTTLDHFTSRSHITTVATGHAGGFLSGKTVEIKNNLKNAAERLFSEIMVSQQKHSGTDLPPTSGCTASSNTIITKHERAIQHRPLLPSGPADPRPNVTVVNTHNEDNCTRISINAPAAGGDASRPRVEQAVVVGARQAVSAFNSPEKKSAAFHEMLISELAAMRTRSCSMENLQTKPLVTQQQPQPQHVDLSVNDTLAHFKGPERRGGQSGHEEDIDADNVEDADGDCDGDGDGDDDDGDINQALQQSLKAIAKSGDSGSRKRSPSGCSSDSSPYGTERSARIRTSDWIEVGDNGKQVTLTSCHISLEDSGMEDEERMDEMSSSGVGDSWDSVKELQQQRQQQQQQQQPQQPPMHQPHQQAKRSRSIKRIMSITDLPPLPKSLSGINKMLASDSGLISDVDTEMAKNAKNMEIQQLDNHKENSLNSSYSNNNNHSNANNNNSSSSSNNNGNTKDNGDVMAGSMSASKVLNGSAAAQSSGADMTSVSSSATTVPLKELNGNETISEIPPAIPGSKLDTQIATLRKEMFGLRQLDLSLLSQLWALNDSIQEFRTMIQEHEQEDDETYSTHSRSPSPYDSVSSDPEDEISALKGKNLRDQQNANHVITSQPKPNHLSLGAAKMEPETSAGLVDARGHWAKPPVPKPLDVKPVPRMRSAPPPPPTHRKSQNAPPRPT